MNVLLRRLLASRMNPEGAPMFSAPGAPLNSLDAIDQKGGPGLVHRQACQARCPLPWLHSLAPSCPCRAASRAPSDGFRCTLAGGRCANPNPTIAPNKPSLPRGRPHATQQQKAHDLGNDPSQALQKALRTHIMGWAKHAIGFCLKQQPPSSDQNQHSEFDRPGCACHHIWTSTQSRQWQPPSAWHPLINPAGWGTV